MLHETAVAWVRYKLARCVPARPWLETAAEYGSRLKAVAAAVNQEHDLEGLCRDLPNRAELVKAEEGGGSHCEGKLYTRAVPHSGNHQN